MVQARTSQSSARSRRWHHCLRAQSSFSGHGSERGLHTAQPLARFVGKRSRRRYAIFARPLGGGRPRLRAGFAGIKVALEF